jgi:hypothetical protein
MESCVGSLDLVKSAYDILRRLNKFDPDCTTSIAKDHLNNGLKYYELAALRIPHSRYIVTSLSHNNVGNIHIICRSKISTS